MITMNEAEKIVFSIMEITHMIDGIDIAIERARELKEKFIFHHEPFETSEALCHSLNALIAILKNDKVDLVAQRRELQSRL